VKVYICYHWEFMDFGHGPFKDGMVLHVASTKEKAEKFMKRQWCDPYSWWELIEFELDGEEGNPVADYITLGFYGNRGGKLRGEPRERCLAAYWKCKGDSKHHLNA